MTSNQFKYNQIYFLELNIEYNLIEGLFIHKSRVRWDIYGGHHKNTCPLVGGQKIKILKANREAKEKRMCLKEQ